MGTGASSASSRSPSPEFAQNQRNSVRGQHLDADENNRKNSLAISVERDRWKGQNVICNDVAPVVISKDCFEEYQCLFLAETQMAVVGAIKNGMPEHNLIQVKREFSSIQFN